MIKAILQRLQGDKLIWLVVFTISLISLLAVYSSTSALAFKYQGGNTEYYLLKHFLLLALGFVMMYGIHLLDYRIFARISKIALYCTIPLLGYTIFQGEESEINSATRWIRIFGLTFQPSDLAKLTIVMYLSRELTEKQALLKDLQKGFLPIIAHVLIVVGFIIPANLSTALLILFTSLMLMYIGGMSLKHLGGLVMVGVLFVLIAFATFERAATWRSRIKDYIERYTNDDYVPGYQTIQSNLAISSGGIMGKGVGKSTQRNFLPHPYSDFIYSIILEEGGLIGGMLVLGLYMILLIRGVGIVTMSKTFGALLAAGLSFMMATQALINMAVTVGLIPVTGLPLPMLSMGGTSIVFTGMSFGMILSVSRQTMKERKEAALV